MTPLRLISPQFSPLFSPCDRLCFYLSFDCQFSASVHLLGLHGTTIIVHLTIGILVHRIGLWAGQLGSVLCVSQYAGPAAVLDFENLFPTTFSQPFFNRNLRLSLIVLGS